MASFSTSLWYSLCFTSTFNTSSLCFYLYSHCFYHRHYYYYHHCKKRRRSCRIVKMTPLACSLLLPTNNRPGHIFWMWVFAHIQISLVTYSDYTRKPRGIWGPNLCPTIEMKRVAWHRSQAPWGRCSKVKGLFLDNRLQEMLQIRAGNMNLMFERERQIGTSLNRRYVHNHNLAHQLLQNKIDFRYPIARVPHIRTSSTNHIQLPH